MTQEREGSRQSRPIDGSPVPLWRNRDYLLLVGGQAISDAGSEVSDLAYILLILAITGSPAQVGIVGALELLPVLALSLYAGTIIDRLDRKRVMIVCDAARALCLSSIVIALAIGRLTIVQIYLVALIESSFSVFFDIADRACLRNVVPREQLPAASAQNQAITYGQGIGAVCWCTALILPLFAPAPNLLVLAAILTLYLVWGRMMGVFNFSYRTALTPDAMQGRVIGIPSLIVRGALPVGIALTGALIQTLGVVPTVLIFTAYRVLIALLVTLNPHVRKAPPLAKIQEGI